MYGRLDNSMMDLIFYLVIWKNSCDVDSKIGCCASRKQGQRMSGFIKSSNPDAKNKNVLKLNIWKVLIPMSKAKCARNKCLFRHYIWLKGKREKKRNIRKLFWSLFRWREIEWKKRNGVEKRAKVSSNFSLQN